MNKEREVEQNSYKKSPKQWDGQPSSPISEEEYTRLMEQQKKDDEAYKKKGLGMCEVFCGHF